MVASEASIVHAVVYAVFTVDMTWLLTEQILLEKLIMVVTRVLVQVCR